MDVRYTILIRNLIGCGNLGQAADYLPHLTDASTRHDLEELLNSASKSSTNEELQTWGLARRPVYPWNSHEPDRSHPSCVSELNASLAAVAPKLEARIVELPDLTGENEGGVVKQLGLFAAEDLAPGEEVLREKSILTAVARLNDAFCDACAVRLPASSLGGGGKETGAVSCPDCAETVFCSQSCLDTAMASYHPALCGGDFDALARDVEAKEASHALYALLLLRAFALSHTQSIHPLALPQTKYLWGDFTSNPSLPWNMHYNLTLPLTILEKMDINIFEASASGEFAPWVFNTLYAKFRGVADAKMGPDGKPEVGAVHPVWCLANHSCAPNVRWEWEGAITFSVRTAAQSVHWRDEEGLGDGVLGRGIKKDEQILGHYCDVELPVKERREWAKGALGGECMCERCVWEAANPERVRVVKVAR